MKLPNAAKAYVDQSKIVDYLLCPSHPDGRSKAQFFMGLGFRTEDWQRLADALRGIGNSNPPIRVVESSYGVRYTIDGPIAAPDDRNPTVRTVWFIERGSTAPRLITAYPNRNQ